LTRAKKLWGQITKKGGVENKTCEEIGTAPLAKTPIVIVSKKWGGRGGENWGEPRLARCRKNDV